MIRVRIDDEVLSRVRVAISPLWETISSLALIVRFRGEVPYPYTNWAEAARRRVPLLLHRELTAMMRTLRATPPPSSLTPIPAMPSPAVEDELAALQAAGHIRFAQLCADYWAAAIAPYWSAMRGALEEEIFVRGRTLVTRGADVMLRDLGGRICWERPELSVPHQADLDWSMNHGRLLIVPVLFARGMRIFTTDGDTVAISYQAQGAAVLSDRTGGATAPVEGPQPGDRLSILLGRGRAAVMRSLVSPTTTTALAGCLGLAPSTVSQHLAVLSAAGLVRRHRAGSRVLYELEDPGLALLDALDGG